jgi:hypothetical protein
MLREAHQVLYKWELTFIARSNEHLGSRKRSYDDSWVEEFLFGVSDPHPAVKNAMQSLELFLTTRSLVDGPSQTPLLTQQVSPQPSSIATPPVIEKVSLDLDIASDYFITDRIL